MIGFETIGNATLTCFDGGPVLSTDPWVEGSPYFGSWDQAYDIPNEQIENITSAKYIWLSHGHPDHINGKSFKYFKNATILIPDHHGDRIFDYFSSKFTCIKLKSNSWFQVSQNIRIKSFADWNQDAALLVDILGQDCILNQNDGSLLGWKDTIKDIVSNYENRFLLKLVNWGDADMINLYAEDGTFILPEASKKPLLGPAYLSHMKNLGCNFAIPFSSFHQYAREDSMHMNQFITPLIHHSDGFYSDKHSLLPAHISWDSIASDYTKIQATKRALQILKPGYFDDNYSDVLEQKDKALLAAYFQSFQHLAKHFGSLTFLVGGEETSIRLSNKTASIYFEAPRHSLMKAVSYEIFDDLLIGNFMKTTLVNCDSLYPNFSPFVGKYGDNGLAKNQQELKKYFKYYKLNSADYWKDMLQINTESMIRNAITSESMLYKAAKNLRDKLRSSFSN
jgi:hypothetical protein